jgi:hypothetical protein
MFAGLDLDDLPSPSCGFSGSVAVLSCGFCFTNQASDRFGSKVVGKLAIWESLSKITKEKVSEPRTES